jgi:hypothetical protein
MEPRWVKEGISFHRTEFVGGVGRFDLWVDAIGDHVTPVWGPHVTEWTTYRITRERVVPRPYHDEKGNPTDEELKLIEHYLRLFAPWVFNKEAA